MQYMLLIYNAPEAWTSLLGERAGRDLHRVRHVHRGDPRVREARRRRRAAGSRHGDVRPGSQRRDAHDGRPVRRDEGVPRRLLPRRRRHARRSARVGREDPRRDVRHDRGAPDRHRLRNDVGVATCGTSFSSTTTTPCGTRCPEEERDAIGAEFVAFNDELRAAGALVVGNELQPGVDRERRLRPRRRDDGHRRAVRRDERGARRLLPRRRRHGRGGARVGRESAVGAVRICRGAPGRPPRAGDLEVEELSSRLPGRAREVRRDPRPRPRRSRPRRGRGAGRVPPRGRALAAGRRARRIPARGSSRRRATRAIDRIRREQTLRAQGAAARARGGSFPRTRRRRFPTNASS